MPALTSPKSPMTIAEGYDARHPSTPLGPPVLWAAWAVEVLHYLDDLDQVQSAYPSPVRGDNPDIVDIAHVRWATGTAITSLDLCAAALGRVYCGWTERNELDLRAFQPRRVRPNRICRLIRPSLPTQVRAYCARLLPDKRTREVTERRARLPPAALLWVDGVLGDSRYRQIHGARNRFTHSWLSRLLFRGGLAGHVDRTQFRIGNSKTTPSARTLVEVSITLATDQVTAFFALIDTL